LSNISDHQSDGRLEKKCCLNTLIKYDIVRGIFSFFIQEKEVNPASAGAHSIVLQHLSQTADFKLKEKNSQTC
jgi:hypothetical protein